MSDLAGPEGSDMTLSFAQASVLLLVVFSTMRVIPPWQPY